MHRVTVTRGVVAAASLVLSVLAACSLTVSPGDYAQGGAVDAAAPRPPVPAGAARVILLAAQRTSFNQDHDDGFAIKETLEGIVQADGTVGQFFYDRAPPVETFGYAQATLDNGRLITSAVVAPRRVRAGSPQIAFAPIDTPSGALTNDWSLLDVDGSVQGRAAVLLVRPSLLVAAGGTESVATEDGGTTAVWNGKVFTASVDIEGRKTGGWTPLAGALSGGHGQGRLLVNKDYLYVIGGSSEAGAIDTVDVARLDGEGKPGAFAATEHLPVPTLLPEVTVAAGRLFAVGGVVGADQLVTAKVFSAPIKDGDGTVGPWTEGPSLPTSLALGGLLFHKDRLYYFGGIRQTPNEAGGIPVQDAVDTIYAADVGADGTLAPWRDVGKLPAPRAGIAAVVLP